MFTTTFWQSSIVPDPSNPTQALNAKNAQYLGGYPASFFLTTPQVSQRNVMEVATGTGNVTLTCVNTHLNKLLYWTPGPVGGHQYQLDIAPYVANPSAFPEIEIYNSSALTSIQILAPTTTPASVLISRFGYTKIAPQGTVVIKLRRNNAGSYEFLLIGALTNL